MVCAPPRAVQLAQRRSHASSSNGTMLRGFDHELQQAGPDPVGMLQLDQLKRERSITGMSAAP
jgi:hypothetical protein